MHTQNRITWRNGFRLNGEPVAINEIEPEFEVRRIAALSVWAKYEEMKEELRKQELSPEQYQAACRQICEALGI